MKVTHNSSPNPQVVDKSKAAEKNAATAKAENPLLAGLVTPASKGSAVEISDEAKLMQKATEIALSTPDIRSDKVALLKKAIQGGTYKVDAEALADKILQEHLSTDLSKSPA